MEGGLRKSSIPLYGSSFRDNGRHKISLWKWDPLSMRSSLGNLEEDSYAWGLCVVDDSVSGVCPYREHVEEPGEGVRLPGIWELTEEVLWLWRFSVCGISVRGPWRRDSFAAEILGYEMKTLEKDISLVMRVQVDKLEWAYTSESLTHVSKIIWRYSLWDHCERNLDGGLPCLGS